MLLLMNTMFVLIRFMYMHSIHVLLAVTFLHSNATIKALGPPMTYRYERQKRIQTPPRSSKEQKNNTQDSSLLLDGTYM